MGCVAFTQIYLGELSFFDFSIAAVSELNSVGLEDEVMVIPTHLHDDPCTPTSNRHPIAIV